MLEVEISQIATYPTSLRLGCVVRYGENGPVRFVSAYVDDRVLSPEVLADLLQWVVRQTNRALDSERGDASPMEEPLF
jgi:hypothetical protein